MVDIDLNFDSSSDSSSTSSDSDSSSTDNDSDVESCDELDFKDYKEKLSINRKVKDNSQRPMLESFIFPENDLTSTSKKLKGSENRKNFVQHVKKLQQAYDHLSNCELLKKEGPLIIKLNKSDVDFCIKTNSYIYIYIYIFISTIIYWIIYMYLFLQNGK